MANTLQFHISIIYELLRQGVMDEEQCNTMTIQILSNEESD